MIYYCLTEIWHNLIHMINRGWVSPLGSIIKLFQFKLIYLRMFKYHLITSYLNWTQSSLSDPDNSLHSARWRITCCSMSLSTISLVLLTRSSHCFISRHFGLLSIHFVYFSKRLYLFMSDLPSVLFLKPKEQFFTHVSVFAANKLLISLNVLYK